jgi:D-alanyl-D-alanine carboxypeptidase (penicillin-binding protein 5/6)
MNKYQIPLHLPISVSYYAAGINGTTADLVSGDILTLKDYLYGMMLPSGNDSAYNLA